MREREREREQKKTHAIYPCAERFRMARKRRARNEMK